MGQRDAFLHISNALHARLPGAIGELGAAWEMRLQFAAEAGAIRPSEQTEAAKRGQKALAEVVAAQSPFHYASNLALRFANLLRRA